MSALIISALVLFGAVSQTIAGVSAATSMTKKEKLGSPLLDETFDTNSWNPAEMAVWGIFMSNFVTPYIDDYKSAFGTNQDEGSKGRGRELMMFGSDSAQTTTVENLIEYAADIQSSSNREVYVRYYKFNVNMTPEEYETFNPNVEVGDWRLATLKDFAIFNDNGINDSLSLDTDSEKINGHVAHTDGWKPKYLGQFAIRKPGTADDADGYDIIFDQTNGYDMNAYAATLVYAMKSPYGSAWFEKYKTYDEEPSKAKAIPLKMDVFGNLCAVENSRNYVVYPACVNQYLTETPSYNLLTSPFVSNQYLSGSDTDIALDLKDAGWGNAVGDTKEHKNELMLLHNSAVQREISEADTWIHAEGTDNIFQWERELYDKYAVRTTHVQTAIETIYSNINNKINGVTVPYKIIYGDTGNIDTYMKWFSGFNGGSMKHLLDYINMRPVYMNPDVRTLAEIDIYGKDVKKLFGSPMVIPAGVGQATSKDKGKNTNEGKNYVKRTFLLFAGYKLNTRRTTTQDGDHEYPNVRLMITGESNRNMLTKVLIHSGDNTSLLFSDYMNARFSSDLKSGSSAEHSLTAYKFKEYSSTQYKDYVDSIPDANDADGQDGWYDPGIIIAVYPKSTSFQNVNAYLSTTISSDDTDLMLWCKSMYYTYLKWYGVITNSYNNKLNSAVFTSDSEIFKKNIGDLVAESTMTEEEKKKEVLNNTFLMLDPEKGRELRKQIYTNNFNDWVFDHYNKMVYGTAGYAATSDSTGGVGAGRASQGFLGVDNYYSNFLTAWFMNIYDDIAIIILGIGIIVILLAWLITKKRAAWMFTSVIMLINIVILTPLLGDVAPYVCDKIIEGTFDKQLEYWALCENVEAMANR